MTSVDQSQLKFLGIDPVQLQTQLDAYGIDLSQLLSTFSFDGIIAVLIFSVIGIIYFLQGKKQKDAIKLICGIGLIAYGYFVYDLVYIILIGILLTITPYLRRFFKKMV